MFLFMVKLDCDVKMVVKELKKVIENYDYKQLESIIVELYKKIPKSKKEDYDIDNYIINLKNDKLKKEKKEPITFNQLEEQFKYFIHCVDNDLYCEPNKIISKTERSKWRFRAKLFYKEFSKIDPTAKNGFLATNYLIELYKRLSYGTHYLKFSNWDTFRALGESQVAYFKNIAKRLLSNNNIENLKILASLLECENDPYNGKDEVCDVFIKYVTPNFREYIINYLEENIITKYKQMIGANDHIIEYNLNEKIYTYSYIVVILCASINNIKKGINIFKKYCREYNKEILEYVLLNILKYNKLYQEWIVEYEEVCNKIKLRDELKEDYIEIKKRLNYD